MGIKKVFWGKASHQKWVSPLIPIQNLVKKYKIAANTNKKSDRWNDAALEYSAELNVALDSVEKDVKRRIIEARGILQNRFWNGFVWGNFIGIIFGILLVKAWVLFFDITITG